MIKSQPDQVDRRMHPIEHYLDQLAKENRRCHLARKAIEPFIISDIRRALASLEPERLVTRQDLLSWFDISLRTIAAMAKEDNFPNPIGKMGRAFVYSLSGIMSWWHRHYGTPAALDRDAAIKIVTAQWLAISKTPNPPIRDYRERLEEILLERPLRLPEAARRLRRSTTSVKSGLGKQLYSVVTDQNKRGMLRVSAADVVVLGHRHLAAKEEVAIAC